MEIKIDPADIEIHDNGNRNPMVAVSKDGVLSILRQIADAHGYSDRDSSAMQVTMTQPSGVVYMLGLPEIVLMLSGFKNPAAGRDGE